VTDTKLKPPAVLEGIKTAVFDLDGTLFDSTRLWAQIDIDFLKKRGLSPTAEYKKGIEALGNREVARFTVEYYKLADTPEALMAEWADMARAEYAHNIRLFDGAREYLERTASRGVMLYAATSLARELAEPCMINNGIMPLFRAIITSDEIGINKSSPEFFKYVAAAADSRPCECAVFDDVALAVCAAKRAGAMTVAVRGDGSYKDGAEESMLHGAADFTVQSVADAPELFPPRIQ